MLRSNLAALVLLLACSPAYGYIIEFDQSDFTRTPVFNDVATFSFTIDLAGPLAPGVYNDPAINSISYTVFGILASGSPSGFPAFNLVRDITGADFYAQGSSLQFEIGAGADLSDGLQVADLVGSNPVFVLNAREVGTGRYHPPLFELNSDGTGQLRNSNNMGGVNPGSGNVVDVEIGDEYIIDLGFAPTGLMLAEPVPEPGTLLTLGTALLLGAGWLRRKRGLR